MKNIIYLNFFKELSFQKSFYISLNPDEILILSNEDKTKYFCSLSTLSGDDSITEIINIIDKLLVNFNFPTFYKVI